MKKLLYSLLLFFLSHAALADDGIDGVWKTPTQDKILIKPCDSSHCMTIISGKYAGKELGKLTLSNKVYKGTSIDPSRSTIFEIEATLSGKTLNVRLAIPEFADIYARTVIWTKE